jgi:hypothetical protein
MKCCICEEEIKVEHGNWDQGHNAEPVRNGRCCSDCNYIVVIPMRLQQARAHYSPK